MSQRNNEKLTKKKRFGQYFSGVRVADLLVSLLPSTVSFDGIVDPMAGIGDLLVSASGRETPGSSVLAVEIDNSVIERCKDNLPQAIVINDDAFNCSEVIRHGGWGLVITNPPYVRYQLQKGENEFDLPNAKSIRENLSKQISKMDHLEAKEKKLFDSIICNYSGLADMAVPSWILCAALAKKDGYIAMVVPETWLSRDYASPIHYLLLKLFDIKVVVKDIGANWFDDALIRTCLVIAQKKDVISFEEATKKSTYCIDIGDELSGESSLIEKLYFSGKSGKQALSLLITSQQQYRQSGFTGRAEQTFKIFPNILQSGIKHWMKEDENLEGLKTTQIPLELADSIPVGHSFKFCDLKMLGFSCGQGMRTGANDFFYCHIDNTARNTKITFRPWYGKTIDIEKRLVLRTLQNRGETSSIIVRKDDLSTGLIYIQDEIRESDFDKASTDIKNAYRLMPASLAAYIDAGETYRVKNGKAFSQLSAVRTNEKKTKSGQERFWYMLPALTNRHTPDLCLTRINSREMECLYIDKSKEKIVVDANFVTVWRDGVESKPLAMFAILNSIWFKCYMELTCTIMGGGALKAEATHLRKVKFPELSIEAQEQLEGIGKKIFEEKVLTNDVQREIDRTIFSSFTDEEFNEFYKDINDILDRKLKERGVSHD